MSKRYLVVAVTAFAAMWMYIDRVCFSTLAGPIQKDLGLSEEQKAKMLSAFFLTYALFQIPMGALADRFGARLVLTVSIAAWSLVTATTGFVQTFAALLAVRLVLGITESGAYPAAAGLVKRWARPKERGRFSSVVAFGGRMGGVLAPLLTALLAGALVGVVVVEWFITPTPAPPGPDGTPPPNWRGVFVVYGFCGLLVAALFWLFVRDRPPSHPALELAKRLPGKPDGQTPDPPKPARSFFQQLVLLARDRNMQLFGALQFGVNIGWAFVITLLPTYLTQSFGTPLSEIGVMQTTALSIGVLGMIFGGFATDFLRRRLGPRLGRSVPIVATLCGCAAIFFLLPALPSVWAVVVALGFMAFLVDLHNPSIWSFAQDVGGKNVGAALGWGNMWGNLGAALSPVLLTEIHLAAGWNAAFIFCGFAFVAAAVCGVLLDATKPVDVSDAN
jgi:MFS transporter, ACS family, glucarate transporter